MNELIKYFGNKTIMARVLDVDKSAVTQWGNEGLPPYRAIQIERITKGAFKAIDIMGLKDDSKE